MNRLYITIIFVLFAIVGQGQNIRVSPNIRKDLCPSPNIRPDLPTEKRPKRKIGGRQNLLELDTVYAIQTAKQHGWFVPLGSLTKEQTKHRYSSVMFTGKNRRGHWTKIETINAYGGHSKGQFLPYILRNGSVDNSANKEWIECLDGNCIVEMIADPQGNNAIQERVYDEKHNLLYVYSRTPIGIDENCRNQYIGSYKDMYGLPAEMRKTEGHTYGTIVKITEDEWGNDHIIEYLDAKGVNKLNADSVFRSVHIYDKNGHELRFGSQNDKEEYVIDSWGNCGVIETWNDDHTMASAMYTDSNWLPMKMPSEKSQEKCGIIKVLYVYDQYKRIVEESFVDEDDNPMTNVYGCHKIKYEFDDKGNVIKQIGYDIDGRLSQQDAGGIAVINNVFDDKGRIKESSFMDKNNMPNSTKGYLSKVKREYDTEGNEILVEQYSAETGQENLYYKSETTQKYTYTLWGDGTSRIDSLDSKGRTTFVGFYGADGKYEMIDGRACECYTYIEQSRKTTQIKVNYDQNGNIVGDLDFAKEVMFVDSVNWSKTIWHYDKNNVLTDVYIHRYTPNFKNLIAQDDANKFGIVSRCGGANSVRYFKGNVMYNQKMENVTHLYGIDEFGEPDYITSNNLIYYYMKSGKHYDVNNNEITDYNAIKDELPKVMTIEVIDSSAYELGLKDNDLIICFGNYSVNLDESISCSDFRREWSIRSVLDAVDSKRMIVFRITDASKNEFGLYEIKNLRGTCSELGFIPHMRFLTEKQKNRITDVIKSEISKGNSIISFSDIKKKNYNEGDNMVLFAYTDLYRDIRNEPYGLTVKDPAILLGTCIKDRGLKWSIDDSSSTSSFEKILGTRWYKALKYPTWQFYFTTNGRDITPLSIECQNVSPVIYGADAYTKWFDAFISDEDFVKITSLYNIASGNIKRTINENQSIPNKSLLGIWVSRKESEDYNAPEIYLVVNKNGTFKGSYVNYGTIKYNDVLAVFKKEKIIDGHWTIGGKWLFYTPESRDSIRITCVDAIGLDEKSKHRAIVYVNVDCRNNPSNYASRLRLLSEDTYGDLYISNYSKNELELIDTNGDTIKIYKEKNLPNILLRDFNNVILNSKDSQISETSPLIGNWECQIPNMKNSHVEFVLEQNGQLGIEMSVTLSQELNDTCSVDVGVDLCIEGTWVPSDKGFNLDIDPSRLAIYMNYDIKGVNDDTKNELLPAIKELYDAQKQELGISLLGSIGDEIEVSEVDSVKMIINGNLFSKIPNARSIVIGRIEGETGYLVEKGYTGLFVILEWCDWNCRQSIDEYKQEFEKQKENVKHLVLLPVESVNDKDVFKDVIELNCPRRQLGIRLMEHQLNYNYFKSQILSRYIEYKKILKQ